MPSTTKRHLTRPSFGHSVCLPRWWPSTSRPTGREGVCISGMRSVPSLLCFYIFTSARPVLSLHGRALPRLYLKTAEAAFLARNRPRSPARGRTVPHHQSSTVALQRATCARLLDRDGQSTLPVTGPAGRRRGPDAGGGALWARGAGGPGLLRSSVPGASHLCLRHQQPQRPPLVG